METKNEILNEMNELSPTVAAIANANVYDVPEGYFSGLADEIIMQVKAEYLLRQNVSVPYKIPENYFTGLSNNILSKIRSENEVFSELEEVAPFLNTITKKNIYTIPTLYFENFSQNINVAKPAPVKVFSIGSQTRKWFTYAAAAVFTGIVGTGIFLRIENHKTIDQQPVKSSYAEINNIDVNQGISGLSDEELAKYLDAHSSENDITVPASAEDNIDVQDFLNNASDEEIQQYLNSTKIPGEKSAKGI
jgi:hypothetical protein